MKKNALVTTICILALPLAAHAETPESGPYISLLAGISVPNNIHATGRGSTGATATSDRLTMDVSSGSNLAGGYDFGALRLEGELGARSFKVSTMSRTGSSFDTDGNLNVATIMGNVYYDFHNTTRFTPFFGGGVGIACLAIDNIYGTDTRTGAVSKLYHSNEHAVFAYQGRAGIGVTLTKHVTLDIGYGYFGTGNADTGRDFPKLSGVKIAAHEALIGFRYKF